MTCLQGFTQTVFRSVGCGMLACLPVQGMAHSLTPDKAPAQHWSFDGPLGHYDLAAVQRGYAVFAGVCAACHSLGAVHFSDLAAAGLSSDQVMALAATWKVPTGPGEPGQSAQRKGQPDDAFPAPYASPDAARAANNGAVPPDLSRVAIVYPGGPDRILALLTRYGAADPQGKPGIHANGFYNPYAIGHRTAMPPPLRDNAVVYADGTAATAAQEARDVTTFLAWVSSPHADSKRRLGVGVALYLCFLAILLVILKRRIWSHVAK
ncbi:ubiquinol-cytochrome C reductase [Acetobacter cibinongensis]|uniref:Cytochrome c1 n=2 Tax=Acetobacter cibinongensis TaxID=146475 RepID=A0A1Z5YR67_9PROT|nr:ubiquinol-cytochrome C reductase [Acetobacter cibinongensis]